MTTTEMKPTDAAIEQQPVVPESVNEKDLPGTKNQEGPSPEKEGDVKASQNTADSVTEEAAVVSAEAWGIAISQLAYQLEYYLSVKNLSKDTYVETLRKLNDGCVPASILANFGKVNQIIVGALGFSGDEPLRIQAVCEAASHCSTKLRVATIDAKTGKQVSEEEVAGLHTNTILAIGTTDNQPIAVLDAAPVASPTSQEFANAIVLRDVASEVTFEEIQQLFQYEGCPSVVSAAPDVANCWFVYLDTTKRADIMDVLLQLRAKTLAGSPVHARIKTYVASSAVPIDPAPLMYSPSWEEPQQQKQQGNSKSNSSSPNRRKNNKKKGNSNNNKSNNKKKGNNNNDSNKNEGNKGGTNNNGNNKKKGSQSPQSTPSSTPSRKKTVVPAPAAFNKEDFPTLVDNRVEWETTPVQDEPKKKELGNTDVSIDSKDDKTEGEEEIKSMRMGSDSASTATTASSSTEPGPKKVGYAAALKNKGSSTSLASMSNSSPVPKTLEPSIPSSPVSVTNTKPVEHAYAESTSTTLTGAGWGRRSFADILREAQAAS